MPSVADRPDIALISIGSTMGWRRADEAFADQVRAAGATCEVLPVRLGASAQLRRTMALTDVIEGLGARRAARHARAGAYVYSSVTAALLQPPRAPSAVRFDGTASLNRPGAGGAWQRRRERSVLAAATLLLPWSEPAAEAALAAVTGQAPQVVLLPPPVPLIAAAGGRRYDAVAYAANPDKRGLDLLCAAWGAAGPPGGRLGVGGLDREEALHWLERLATAEPPGVEWLGRVDPQRWLGLVAGARVFLNASRFEDWGLAQMEALSAGTPLVTVPTPGPNAALPLARELAPELVAGERSATALAGALRAGLALDDEARSAYALAADRMLEPYREPELRRRVAEEILPRLLDRSS